MFFFIEVEDEGRGGGESEKGKKKGGIPAIKSRCAEFGTLICGSGMRARNLCSEGAAALSGVFWALLIPGNKTRVKFLIQAEILGLSALRSVIGAAFIHTRNSHLFQSPPYTYKENWRCPRVQQ